MTDSNTTSGNAGQTPATPQPAAPAAQPVAPAPAPSSPPAASKPQDESVVLKIRYDADLAYANQKLLQKELLEKFRAVGATKVSVTAKNFALVHLPQSRVNEAFKKFDHKPMILLGNTVAISLHRDKSEQRGSGGHTHGDKSKPEQSKKVSVDFRVDGPIHDTTGKQSFEAAVSNSGNAKAVYEFHSSHNLYVYKSNDPTQRLPHREGIESDDKGKLRVAIRILDLAGEEAPCVLVHVVATEPLNATSSQRGLVRDFD